MKAEMPRICVTGRTLTWTSFQKPRTMAKGSTTSTFEYGPERKRVRQVKVKGAVTEVVTCVGGLYEQVEKTGAATEHVHDIFAGACASRWRRRARRRAPARSCATCTRTTWARWAW